ncbi:MAG: tagaturonate reductase [Sphaerochaetaceae bacterium]
MKSILDVRQPVERPVRVLQYGEGNFLRAFVDWQFDKLNEKAGFNGNIVLVQPLARGMGQMINGQKGLYTTVLRGVQDGKPVVEHRIVDSVKECLNPYEPGDYGKYMGYAECPTLRFIVSNTTEAGISYAPGCKPEDEPPLSYPAKVCQFLYRRYRFFHGDAGKGLIIIPCELIEKNGDNLKRIVLQYADEWKLERGFGDWLEEACDFCNSLVDRIVPGYPKAEAEKICQELGYRDNLLDSAEIFHLWVIECHKAPHSHEDELPFDKAGLNVVWTDDMSFYRTRKVRILNGTHTMFVPAGFLYGFDCVRDCIEDPVMIRFIKKGLFGEIIPSMDGDEKMLTKYADDVLERFDNPYIYHMLLSITLNSTSKFKTRDLPSVKGYIRKTGKAPAILSFSIAALVAFYDGKDIHDRQMTGMRNGKPYAIQDDESALSFFRDLHAKTDEPRQLARETLAHAEFWGEDLTALSGLEDAVASAIASIQQKGMRKAIQDLVK